MAKVNDLNAFGRDEFTRVAFGVPLAGIRVSPTFGRFRVQVVEDALDHAGIEEEALESVTVPLAALIGEPAIDEEGIA